MLPLVDGRVSTAIVREAYRKATRKKMKKIMKTRVATNSGKASKSPRPLAVLPVQ